MSHSHLVAVVTLRVEVKSTFERSPKTRCMVADRRSAAWSPIKAIAMEVRLKGPVIKVKVKEPIVRLLQ